MPETRRSTHARSTPLPGPTGSTASSNGVTTVTSQFVLRDGKWQLDPSVTLTLPAGRNQPASQAFFQPCVDWVLDNVPDGAKYVTSYGNNDYYTGASAYQGNFDFRASSAKTQCPDVYGSMSDEEVVRTEQMHFEREVGPGVLAQLYPEMRLSANCSPPSPSTASATTERPPIRRP